jgi:hypothetical protein
MAVYYDDEAETFAVSPDECPDCGEPRYDTGCAAPGCNGVAFPCCGTGCDIEQEESRCQVALDNEDEDETEDRINRERAAFGLGEVTH